MLALRVACDEAGHGTGRPGTSPQLHGDGRPSVRGIVDQAISEVMRGKGATVVEVGEASDPCRVEAHAIDGGAAGVPRGKVEVAEHVIEGAVLHHDDHDVL